MSDVPRVRVLIVPDWVPWVTGTIARSVARFNPWVEATVVSGHVLDRLAAEDPELLTRFDLAHFVCPFASMRWLPRLRDRMPVVTSHHHVSEWEVIRHNLDGDAVVVGSPQWKEDLVARGAPPDRVVCVPYGVDAGLFRPAGAVGRVAARRALGVADDRVVVGFFAKKSSNDGHYDRKGTDVFRQAARLLAAELPNLTVLVVGPGWDEMAREFAASGVHCVWLPYVRDAAGLARTYRALDFYWVTARVEGGPVTLLEAMATEVVCVSTPVGLARELVEDGVNAAAVAFNNPAGVARRTAALAADPEARRRLGASARRTVLERMDLPVVTRLYADAYARASEVFAERHPGAAVPDVRGAAAGFAAAPAGPRGGPVPLGGILPRMRSRTRMLEALSWSEALAAQGQPAEAARLVARECVAHPFASEPWRAAARRLLPVGVVARAVAVKKRLRPEKG